MTSTLSATFGRENGESLKLPLGRSVFDHDVAVLDVTEVTQPLSQALDERIGRRAVTQETDAVDLPRLLRSSH